MLLRGLLPGGVLLRCVFADALWARVPVLLRGALLGGVLAAAWCAAARCSVAGWRCVLLRCLLLRCALLRPLDAALRAVFSARAPSAAVGGCAARSVARAVYLLGILPPLAQPFVLPRVLATNLAVACLIGTTRYNYCSAKKLVI